METSRFTRRLTSTIAAATAAGFVLAGSIAAPVSAAAPPAKSEVKTGSKAGNVGILRALTTDGTAFDDDLSDFDIAEAAIRALVDYRPDSDLALLADGSKRATYFLPTDAAFVALVTTQEGEPPATEADAFDQLYIGSILEDQLLMGLVVGKVLGQSKLRATAGRRIRVAQNQDLRIRIHHDRVRLVDRRNRAIITEFGINRGNKQIAHGLDRVLQNVGR